MFHNLIEVFWVNVVSMINCIIFLEIILNLLDIRIFHLPNYIKMKSISKIKNELKINK